MSDTDENSNSSDDDTDVDQKPEKDDETEIEEDNVSVTNKDKNQNTVPKKWWQTQCKYCKLVLKRTSLKRHIMSVHKPTFVECPMSSCNKQIKTTQMSDHLRRSHNLTKNQTNRHASKVSLSNELNRLIHFTLN